MTAPTRGVRRLAGTLLASALAVLAAGLAAPAQAAPACAGTSTWHGLRGDYSATYPTTGNGTFDTRCVLGIDSTGSGVRALQFALNACYSSNIEVDGDYGMYTHMAVNSVWQQEFHDPAISPYTNSLRMFMEWPNWHYASGSWHYHCIDNG